MHTSISVHLDPSGRSASRRDLAYRFARLVQRAVVSGVSLTKGVTVSGRRNVPPSGAAIVVAYHRADIDPVALSVGVKRPIQWLYGDFLNRVPLVRSLVRGLHYVGVAVHGATGVPSIRRIRATLDAGHLVGIFPEGVHPLLDDGIGVVSSEQRSIDGKPAPVWCSTRRRDDVRFSPKFARLAMHTGCPVVPALVFPRSCRVTPYPVPRRVRRWMGLPRRIADLQFRRVYDRILVRYGPPVAPPPLRPETLRRDAETFSRHIDQILNEMCRTEVER